MYYKVVTKGQKVVSAHEISKTIYETAVSPDSIAFFEDATVGGKETPVKYGLRSSREGREEVYHFIKQLGLAPAYIRNGVKEIIEGAK